jgi:protocatechuate 3,4-dioxygenase beta subunit
MPTEQRLLTGIAKDSGGSPLANAIVNLFRVDYDSGNNKIYTHIGKSISDASGVYTFYVNRTSKYRVTADKNDLTTAGISYDTLSA